MVENEIQHPVVEMGKNNRLLYVLCYVQANKGKTGMARKYILLALVVLIPVLAVLLLTRLPATAATAYLGCKPVFLTVKTGQTFYLTVAVTDTIDLYAWQFDADYNGTYLDFLRVVPGNHLRTDGAAHYYLSPVNNTSSTIAERAAATRLSQHVGVDGSGEIAYVFFRAIKQVTTGTNVTLKNSLLVDRNALSISRTLVNSGNCKVTIRDAADDLIQPPVGELIFLPAILR